MAPRHHRGVRHSVPTLEGFGLRWFTALGFGARLFGRFLARPAAWRHWTVWSPR